MRLHSPPPPCCLQAAHKVLSEEHSQLLSRQVGVTSQRTSLRQQLLTMEEQYMQARTQVGQCTTGNMALSSGFKHASVDNSLRQTSLSFNVCLY